MIKKILINTSFLLSLFENSFENTIDKLEVCPLSLKKMSSFKINYYQ